MTMTTILANITAPEPAARPVRRGRRPCVADPAKRAIQVRVAESCLLYGWTRKKAAIRFGISLRTAKAWVKAATGYPEGQHLIPFARTRRDAD
jgi:hypothetical protein